MANLTRIIQALYCQPWLISPEMHYRLCEIVKSHVDETSHQAGGIALAKHAQRHGPTNGAAIEWWQDSWGDANGVKWFGNVVAIDISGVIGRKFSSCLNSSGVTSIDVLDRLISAALDDDRVTGIVLDIDSPGGTVTQVPEVARTIANAATQKPIVSFVGGMMASAAYWLGVGSDAIIASDSAEVGSIGVYSAFLDRSRQFQLEGLNVELFKTGKYKGMGMPGLPLTDDQRELIQADVNKIFGWFVNSVRANRRNVSDSAMQGQTFFGEDALANNLIDKIGTINDAIQMASQPKRQ